MAHPYSERFPNPSGALIFHICSILLFIGAGVFFIWLVGGSCSGHLAKNVFYGSSFLVITLGMLVYSVIPSRMRSAGIAVLWASTVIGIACFIAGMALPSPECLPLDFDDGTPQTVVPV